MSKEIDDYINEQVAAGRATKQQILEQFAKSDDAELTAYAATANKTKVEETKKTMMELATTPHPTIGVSPLDVALYGGAAALSWQAGKKLADLGIQGMSNLGGQISNTIFGKAGTSAPPPSASTQDLMATPDVEKTPIANKIAAESEAKFGVPLSDVEKHFDVKITNLKDAEILSNSYKNSLSGAVSNQPAGVPTIQPNVPANPAGAFAQTPNYSPTPPAPQGGFDPSRIGQPLQDPLAGRGYQTPVQEIGPRASVGEAVATDGNVDKAIKQTVANQLDQTPVAPPQGMKEQYKKSKSQPIGPGGYNWFASQVGHEAAPARWAEQYGEMNVPHAQVQREFSETRYPPKPNPTGAKTGGAFGSPKYIPEYIKGNASLGGMAATMGAAAIPALAAAGYHAYQGNKEKVNAELKDAWNSMKSVVTMPVDVAKAAGKGDFGPFKDLLMSINPGTLLMNEANKRDESAIQRMIQAEKVGAGRGIAPPSAYQR